MRNRKGIFFLALLVLVAALGTARWCFEGKAPSRAPESTVKKADYYYCAMHPWFHQDHPGNCGICGMTLLKKELGVGGEKVGASIPGESEGMPEALKGMAAVDLSPFQQQLIGLRTTVVANGPVVRIIRTVGRFAGGEDDFAEVASDFTARNPRVSEKKRYLVADVYALDIPYVKAGQRAWVSAFSGSGPRLEGLVTRVYPYDGTQSRVRRVEIKLPGIPSSELFANVEIEAASPPLLSVDSDAVMVTGLHRYVFVKKSGETFAPREITVGFEGDHQCQIISGLTAGETVVSGANFMVDADSQLKANFAAMDSQEK